MSSTARSDPIVAVVCFQGTPPIGSRGTSLPLGRWMRVLDECRCFAEGHLGRGCDVQRGTRAGCGTDSSQKWTASLVIRQLMSEQETPISLLLTLTRLPAVFRKNESLPLASRCPPLCARDDCNRDTR